MTQYIRRNQPCPCGSGKKYKRCCGGVAQPYLDLSLPDPRLIIDQHRARERIREKQQGLGRPIISVKAGSHQIVAVGNRVFWSPSWKTFPDFLADYLKQILGRDWGNAELAKPVNERHPILQWYDAVCRYQQQTIPTPGEVSEAPVIGVVACYLGLAYNLYLLDHNVELQDRLVKRLKDPGNFQGAYYELIVTNALIRAGFTLTLEDETDEASKHCEFAAVSKRTGKKYWVEAKMRAVPGLLGRTDRDGTTDPDPLSRLIPHLNSALKKPASDERLIFIDLNTDPDPSLEQGKPKWHDRAVARLEQYERRELKPGVHAYVFVTNLAYHRALTERPTFAAVPFGLGMPDFNRPGYIRLADAYRQRQKHADAFQIGESLMQLLRFPVTLDGSLPSETLGGRPPRVSIGETYIFEGVGEGGTIGTVTAANVFESEGKTFIGITDQTGQSQILTYPMSAEELADYKAHPDAYFGTIQPVGRTVKTAFGMFEWLMEAHASLPRAALLDRLAALPSFEMLKDMSDKDLLAEYCEAMVGAFHASGFVTDTGQPPEETNGNARRRGGKAA